MSRERCLPPLLLLAAACLLFGAREARACSCAPPPTVLDQYERAEEVVVVRVVSVEKTEKAAPEGRMSDGTNYVSGVMSTRTVVERTFKGGLKAGEEMVFAQGGGADCVWTFDDGDVGERFLFYLHRPGDSSVWIAGTCGRSRRLAYARDDMLYLDKLDKVRGRTRVSGTLHFWGKDAPSAAGRKLRITGAAGKTHELKTDEYGVYEIYDLPAGKYTVEIETPPGWKISNFMPSRPPGVAGADGESSPRKISVVLEEKKHAALDITFYIDNAIRGKVFDPTGRPMDGVCLNLLPADGPPPQYFYEADCTENGGAFEIDEITPGRYVIVVNQDGKVTADEPFGTFYHPNVARREDATVFQIGPGDFIENVRIYAPKAAETVTVEGVFLYSDGRPVADERVEFWSAAAEAAPEDEADSDVTVKTDARGRFALKILKGRVGNLYGAMFAYVGLFENCPKLEAVIRQHGDTSAELRTAPAPVRAEGDIRGVELRYPFPGCKKKPRKE